MSEQRIALTDKDLDHLSGLMILGFSMAECAMIIMEHEYAYRYDKSKEYQNAVKKYGKAYADTIVLDTVVKQLRGDERNKIGELLKAFGRAKYLMETLTGSALNAREDGTTAMEIYDALHNNTNYWCYIYLLMSNLSSKEDFLKIESQIKVLAKTENVSDRVINLFDNHFKR